MVASNTEMEELYRKRLMVVATGILIFVIAGGSLSSVAPAQNSTEITIFGVRLLFKNAKFLEWAGIAVMWYFWLRHQQFSFEVRSDLKNQIFNGISICRTATERVRRAEVTHYHGPGDYEGHFRRVKFFVAKDYEWCPSDTDGRHSYSASVNMLSPFRIVICMTSVGGGQNKSIGWQIDEIKGVAEHLQFYAAYIFSYLKCVYKYPEFCHAKLPSWLAITSFTLYIVNAFV